ncbi:alpha/beta fold hydrolase [Microbacterium sp. BWT-B31]|uniref:alpha/beta fold hydrolase n=1 Tax=Microbacterium sp. BWT-B31 TaxID=3232072 RepID=UPI0035288C62
MKMTRQWDGLESGPVLVLAHSLGGSARMWDPLVAELGGRFRVLRYDLPGHTKAGSPWAVDSFTFDDMVAWTAELLEQESVTDALFAGLAAGGAIAVALAAKRADIVRGVILINTPVRQHSRFWLERAAAARESGMDSIAERLTADWFPDGGGDAFIAEIRSLDAAGYAAVCEAVAGLDIASVLPRVEVPAMVVCAVDDESVDPANSDELTVALPKAWIERIASGGHLLPVRFPAMIATLICDGFESTTVRGTPMSAEISREGAQS